jgi:hypothetical protein
MINLGERRARLVKETTSRVGQPDARRVSFEQGYAERVLQGPHPTADRGLTNAEHLRRSAEAQMLGHEQGLSDGIDIDHAPDLLSLSFASAEGDSLARPYWQNRGDFAGCGPYRRRIAIWITKQFIERMS